VQIRSSVI